MKFIKKYEELILEAKVINFINPTGNFIVVSGGPGSGKDYLSTRIIDLEYKEFNVDNFRISMAKKWWGENWKEKISSDEGYKEMHSKMHTTSDPRNVTMKMLRHFLKIDRNHLGNIVYNGGGTHVDTTKVVHDLAKRAGYETTIIYIETNEETALQRNKKRDRSLPKEMVLDYRDRVESGKQELIPIFDNAWVYINDKEFNMKQRSFNNIVKLK